MHSNTLSKLITMSTIGFCSSVAPAQHTYLAFPLESPSPAMDNAFGVGLAMNEEYLAVGSYRDNISTGHDGRVYLYDADTGAYVRTINRTSASPNGSFGRSIDFDNDLMLVGSPVDGQPGIGTPGAGFLYNANSGALIANFYAQIRNPGDRIGNSVAIQEPLALLGAPGFDAGGHNAGAVHAFSTSLLFQITTLLPDEPIVDEFFGASVAIQGDYIVVGAPAEFSSTTLTGSVYVFDVTTGAQLHRIVPPGSAPGDTVGASVDISDGIIAIGAPYNDTGANAAGIVYLYDAHSGALLNTYTPPNPGTLDRYGTSVSIESGVLVVGAIGRGESLLDAGSVFIYSPDSVNEFSPQSISSGQWFGWSVVINDGRIAASGIGFGGVEGYAALLGRFCNADINFDGVRDFFDVSAFIKFAIDYNGDGTFDFFDVSAFLADFNSDCI